MAVQIKVSVGGYFFETYQATTRANVPVATNTFNDTNTTSGIIWPAGSDPENPLSVTPTVAWVSSSAGTFSVALSSATTLAIPPGNYWLRASAAVGSDRVDLMICELIILGMGASLTPPSTTSVSGPSATDLGLLPTLYCTDEHIAIRCGPDFTALQPDSQLLAWGNDGVFSPGDSWTMTSPSNDFDNQLSTIWLQEAIGTIAQSTAITSKVGYICWLRKPQSAFPAGGHLLGIAAANGSNLTLRRIGMGTNQGQAPSPAAGLIGVSFQIATFRPQIEEATYDLNQRFLIDTRIVARDPSAIDDLRVLRRTCVAMVLLDRYSDASRAGAGDYGFKVDLIRREIEELRSKLTIRWGLSTSLGTGSIRQTNWFSTRIER